MIPRSLMNKQYSKLKSTHDFYTRQTESNRVITKYPDRIPIICEKSKKSDLVEIDKHKYLVPCDLTCSQFIYVIRKRLQLPSEKAIFIMINGTIPQSTCNIIELYEKYKDDDGFLYINYTSENVFGILYNWHFSW